MDKRAPLTVAGIILALAAVLHVLRIIYHWKVSVAGHNFSMTASIIALIVTAILALWMFVAAIKK